MMQARSMPEQQRFRHTCSDRYIVCTADEAVRILCNNRLYNEEEGIEHGRAEERLL